MINAFQEIQDTVAVAQEAAQSSSTDNFVDIFLWAGGLLFVTVLIVLPLIAATISLIKPNDSKPKLKGLGLPEGSVRSMLALLIVGSYMIVALIGVGYKGEGELRHLGEILSALAGVAGAVIGFYFGSRGSKGSSVPEKSGASGANTSNNGNNVEQGSEKSKNDRPQKQLEQGESGQDGDDSKDQA